MADSTTPPLVVFDGTSGKPAQISYNVPMPGSHTGRRLLKLDIPLNSADWQPEAMASGASIASLLGMSKSGNQYTFDIQKAFALWLNAARKAGMSEAVLRMLEGLMTKDLLTKKPDEDTLLALVDRATQRQLAAERMSGRKPMSVNAGQVMNAAKEVAKYLAALAEGVVLLPSTDWSGRLVSARTEVDLTAKPALVLIEVFGISSFLGNYGMGRTVKTFTLLPGESTTITVKTWRSSSETVSEATSIIDSHDSKASERFSDKLQSETSEKSSASSQENWHAEANASASWGWGSANVSGGGGGEYHSARESFARQVGESTREHASESSAKRETSVSTSSERTEESGEEHLVERVIKNVNMRRTLNFVFRELNQEYSTKLHLKDIRIAFTNGREGSWREVPLTGLRKLLNDVLKQPKADQVATDILKTIAVVFNEKDQPVRMIEAVDAIGETWRVVPDADIVRAGYPAPTATRFYRVKRGPLGQDGQSNQVDGVIMQDDVIVMRTDSVAVEALLGLSDALDGYAMQVQEANADQRTLANKREQLAHDCLRAITDPEKRAQAFAAMFAPAPAKAGGAEA